MFCFVVYANRQEVGILWETRQFEIEQAVGAARVVACGLAGRGLPGAQVR